MKHFIAALCCAFKFQTTYKFHCECTRNHLWSIKPPDTKRRKNDAKEISLCAFSNVVAT